MPTRLRGVLLLASLVLLVLPTGAGAQPELEEPARSDASIVVTGLEAMLGPGTVPEDAEAPEDLSLRVLVENTGATPLGDLELVVVVHAPVETRSELRQALDRNQPEGFVTATSPAIRDGATLGPGEIAGLDVVVPASEAGWTGTDAIYPVGLAVVRGREVLDEVTTAVVHLTEPPEDSPRRDRDPDGRGTVVGVVVWPLSTTPWRGPDGVYPPDVDEEIAPGGRLDRLLAALESTPSARVLLAPDPHLLEDLHDRADGFEELRTDDTVTVPADSPAAQRARDFLERLDAVAGRLPFAPVAGAYADADITALQGSIEPLPRLAATAVSEGRIRLRRLLDREPDTATHLTYGPLDPATVDLVPAEHLLVPWEATEGPDLSTDPTLPTATRALRSASGRRVHATVSDPYVSDLVGAQTSAHGDPVAVQRLLAEIAMVHLEFPGLVRPLLVLPAPDWQPDPHVAARLLPALADATWLTLVTPSEQLEATSRNPGSLRFATPASSLEPPIPDALARASTELAALVRALPDEVGTIGGREAQALEQQLLRATSRRYGGNGASRRAALVADVQTDLDEAFGSVRVPATAQVTLTSERGAIPVTLQRDQGGPLRVQVTVSSRGNLRWPERTQEVELLGSGTQTVAFDTFALGRGTFAVTVRVHDVTGTRLLDEATLSVRSTAISRPALVATAAVIVALLLWGMIRRRRPRRPALEVVREPAGRR